MYKKNRWLRAGALCAIVGVFSIFSAPSARAQLRTVDSKQHTCDEMDLRRSNPAFVYRGQDDVRETDEALIQPVAAELVLEEASHLTSADDASIDDDLISSDDLIVGDDLAFCQKSAYQKSPKQKTAYQKSPKQCMDVVIDDACMQKGASRFCSPCRMRSSLFAEGLYLHTTGVDMPYGIPQDGIGAPGTVPVGDEGVADFGYESGLRAGFRIALDDCSAIEASYTWFESKAQDAISVGGLNVINPLLLYPTTTNAGAEAQSASANYEIGFQLADIAYRAGWLCTDRYFVDVLFGGRYGRLEQDFSATYPFGAPDGTTTDTTHIAFDGVGLQIGLETERQLRVCSPLRVYAKGMASILSGEFRSEYTQVNQFNGLEARLGWEDDRFVPILDAELGIALVMADRLRLSVGYVMSAWTNVVTTPAWMQEVKGPNFGQVEDTITFDGLVWRAELRF